MERIKVVFCSTVASFLPTSETRIGSVHLSLGEIDGDSTMDGNTYCNRHEREKRKQKNRQKRLSIMSTTLSQAFAFW